VVERLGKVDRLFKHFTECGAEGLRAVWKGFSWPLFGLSFSRREKEIPLQRWVLNYDDVEETI
jgi:hypothetical protein